MAIPFIAVVGCVVGALGTGAVVLGGTVASMSVGPTATQAVPLGPPGTPALSPVIAAAAQAAVATCPGLDWALLGGGALIDPSLEADLTSVATDLCALAPQSRPSALAALLPGPTQGQVALVLARALDADPALTTQAAGAITFAAANLGAPYRWGGTGPGGFDCSGLTQAAYRSAGVAIPRVAQDQFDAGPLVPSSASLQPGDLVFFGSGPGGVTHVGLYVGGGAMIDAPHTGAFVRLEPTPTTPGAPFGTDVYVGATRP
jgi:cell wall-associated NlpC family hydrolase